MGGKTEWKPFAIVGIAMVAITFTDLSPEGPWNDETFTSGSIGLIGIVCIYLAWFRFTFNRKGLIPTIDLWSNPDKSSIQVIIAGIVFLALGFSLGRIDFFPEPSGLILTLVGTLVLTNGIYVWLSVVGPLAEKNDESE